MREHRWSIAVLLLAVIGFTLAFTWLLHARYRAFFSYDPRDEAVNNQTLYNTAHGHLLRSTIKGDIIFHMHFRPIFLPLAIPYLFHRGPTAYYFATALILALGALAAFGLGEDLFGDRRLALLAGLAWLLFAPLHELALGNFDPETLVATLWLAAFLFFRRRLAKPFWLFAILAVTAKETQAPVLAAFGVLALIERRKWTWSVLPIAIGSVWFIASLKLIIPLFHPAFDTIYGRFAGVHTTSFWPDFLGAWRANPRYMLELIFSAEHLRLLGMVLAATGGLAAFSPLTLIPAGPILLEIILLADPLPVRQAHVLAAVAPFVFAAGLLGLARLGRWLGGKKNTVSAVLLVAWLALLLVLPWLAGPFGKGRTYGAENQLPDTLFDAGWYRARPDAERAWAMIGRINPDAPAMTNERYLLALSSRAELYEFGNQGGNLEAYNDVDWILLGLTEPWCPTCTYARLTPASLDTALRLIRENRFVVEGVADQVMLLRRATLNGPPLLPQNTEKALSLLEALKQKKEQEAQSP